MASKSETSNPQSPIPNPSSLSTIHYPLFTIKTPTATVTDLGTEFAVEVSKEGYAMSHVFRGKVQVQTTPADGNVHTEAKILNANESMRVEGHDANRRIVLLSTLTPSSFVREIPKRPIKVFDLVDVVAGGDGFSNRRNRASI